MFQRRCWVIRVERGLIIALAEIDATLVPRVVLVAITLVGIFAEMMRYNRPSRNSP
jgi:hypothetical protein